MAVVGQAERKLAGGVTAPVNRQALNLSHGSSAVALQNVVQIGTDNADALVRNVGVGQGPDEADHVAFGAGDACVAHHRNIALIRAQKGCIGRSQVGDVLCHVANHIAAGDVAGMGGGSFGLQGHKVQILAIE